MATSGNQLAASLATIRELQKDGRRVFKSREFTRGDRSRLLQAGFLRDITRGWLVASQPGDAPADSTPWYASFWEFCARYCEDRFGAEWHLSPDQSLLLHGESTAIPSQVVVYSPRGANNTLRMPFETSLLDVREETEPSGSDLVERDGLRLFTLDAALVEATPRFFQRHPIEAQVAMSSIRDTSLLLRRLLDGGRSTVAGRIAGGMRAIERPDAADNIVKTMRAAGHDVRESKPFDAQAKLATTRPAAPITQRIHTLWHAYRDDVAELFPAEPGLPKDRDTYIHAVDDEYRSDAYHSLSIEGYRVTPDLIARVQAGDWDPANHVRDRRATDALAARGYWDAFQLVRDCVQEVIAGADGAALVQQAHQDWYRAMFQPSVAANLVPSSALAGYRHDAVYLRGSRHVPPRSEVVPDAIDALFELLHEESQASVRAVLSHWLIGYIHPYPDGNGRLARFVMNVMLASGGFPWTVIRVDDRDDYMGALESASVDGDIRPFATFIADSVMRAT